jgi:hypothetical protein
MPDTAAPSPVIAVRRPRRRRQSGYEIIEFGLMAILYVPLFMGMFVVGMNLIKSLQASLLIRDLGNIAIHGGDFSSSQMQLLAQRLGNSLNIQIPAFGSGITNMQTNTAASGDGIIWMTEVMYVGPTTGAQCTTVGSGNCTNHDSFVYISQVVFGSSTVNAAHPSQFGSAAGNGASFANSGASGSVLNYLTSAGAKLPTAAQATMTTIWQTTNNGQQSLTDGQVVYISEGYFQTPTLTLGNTGTDGVSQGVYARSFF